MTTSSSGESGRPTSATDLPGQSSLDRCALRIARPTSDLRVAEAFWVDGVGLDVLWRSEPGGPGHQLLMVGFPSAQWHLELVDDPLVARRRPPSEEDLLVLYVGGPIPEELVARICAHGGSRVSARNPYWDQWGVTIEDPDSYRLVLSPRDW